jgi:hypothetical protein
LPDLEFARAAVLNSLNAAGQDLRAAVLCQEGEGPEWAAAEAERAIHDDSVGRFYRGVAIPENRYLGLHRRPI